MDVNGIAHMSFLFRSICAFEFGHSVLISYLNKYLFENIDHIFGICKFIEYIHFY